jgi:glycosyltransferase involved in cell wall biosynthesis
LDKPLVSVIIPAFNAAACIRRALNSVLAQTYQAIEVIVVDDGSSDATSAVVEEFATKDARFQLVRQNNAGVGAARNMSIGRLKSPGAVTTGSRFSSPGFRELHYSMPSLANFSRNAN